MIIIDEPSTTYADDDFNLFLPTEFTFYEKSYNLNGQTNVIGKFSGQITQGITHVINLDYYSGSYLLRVDGGTAITSVSPYSGKAQLAVALVYYEP